MVHSGSMELRNQLPSSHPLTAPVHPPERVTGPPELHHSKGRDLASALQRLKELGILNWVRRCREDQDEKGRFCLRQESNAYALLPWTQWRGFHSAPPAPPPDPESWGAAPVLPTALEDALIEARQGGDQVAQLRRLEADPGDQLAAALANLFGSIAAAAQR